MKQPEAFMIRTQDRSPPSFTPGHPTALRTYFTAVRLGFELDEAGQVFYIVVDSSRDLSITVEEVFGLSIRPKYNAPLAASGVVNATTAFVRIAANVTGLESLTRYTLWAAAVDLFGNRMTQLAQLRFETLDDVPPLLEASVDEISTGSARIRVGLDEPGFVYYLAQSLVDQQASCPTPDQLKPSLKAAPVNSTRGTIAIDEAALSDTRCSITLLHAAVCSLARQ
jgi:hypothetical protein